MLSKLLVLDIVNDTGGNYLETSAMIVTVSLELRRERERPEEKSRRSKRVHLTVVICRSGSDWNSSCLLH